MKQEKRKFLCVVDSSYFQYWCVFSAVNEFIKNYAEEAATWIKPVEECDQENLPDLLNCATFRRVLKNVVMRRLDGIEGILKQNFQDEIDSCDGIDTLFACDDSLGNNFRLALYPQYKANRLLVKRQYKVRPIKDYILNVIYPELGLEENYGYRIIKVEGAEGDDVIATALKKFSDRYAGTALIASDHDFLQIDGIREFDMFGKEAKRTLGNEEVSSADFLLGKILMGDKSDNIQQVFPKCGPKTALKLTKDKNALKRMLNENVSYSKRFALNKKIISFDEMPNDLSERVYRAISEAFWTEDAMNDASDLANFMAL